MKNVLIKVEVGDKVEYEDLRTETLIVGDVHYILSDKENELQGTPTITVKVRGEIKPQCVAIERITSIKKKGKGTWYKFIN